VRLRRACFLRRHAPHDSAASCVPGISIRELHRHRSWCSHHEDTSQANYWSARLGSARAWAPQTCLRGSLCVFRHPQDTAKPLRTERKNGRPQRWQAQKNSAKEWAGALSRIRSLPTRKTPRLREGFFWGRDSGEAPVWSLTSSFSVTSVAASDPCSWLESSCWRAVPDRSSAS
jgi:hypothetical protein